MTDENKLPGTESVQDDGHEVGPDLRFGAMIAAAREAAGYSVERVTNATRIKEEFIRALEKGQVEILPGLVFARGFLKNLCRLYHVEPAPYLEAFEAMLAMRSLPETPDTLTVGKAQPKAEAEAKAGASATPAARPAQTAPVAKPTAPAKPAPSMHGATSAPAAKPTPPHAGLDTLPGLPPLDASAVASAAKADAAGNSPWRWAVVVGVLVVAGGLVARFATDGRKAATQAKVAATNMPPETTVATLPGPETEGADAPETLVPSNQPVAEEAGPDANAPDLADGSPAAAPDAASPADTAASAAQAANAPSAAPAANAPAAVPAVAANTNQAATAPSAAVAANGNATAAPSKVAANSTPAAPAPTAAPSAAPAANAPAAAPTVAANTPASATAANAKAPVAATAPATAATTTPAANPARPAVNGADPAHPQTLEIVAKEPVRIKIKKDDATWETIELQANTYRYEFQEAVQLMVYDAAAVDVSFNGRNLGPLGAKGRVRRLSFHGFDRGAATANKL